MAATPQRDSGRHRRRRGRAVGGGGVTAVATAAIAALVARSATFRCALLGCLSAAV